MVATILGGKANVPKKKGARWARARRPDGATHCKIGKRG
jgi:hypothetical protein